MKFDYERLYRDIKIELAKINKTYSWLSKHIEVNRSTLWRLSQNKEIKLSNLFKILDWLKVDIKRYIITW